MDEWYDKEKWDKEYVTMCKKADPFLKGFDEEFNGLQLFSDGYHIYIKPNGKGGGIWAMQHFPNKKEYKGIFGDDTSEFRVYRQDELQKIILKIMDGFNWTDYDLMCNFQDWISDPQFIQMMECHGYDNLDKLWLAFVMEKGFKRFWNLDSWDEVI